MRNWQFDKTFSRRIQSRRAQIPRMGVCDLSDERGQAIVIIALVMIALVAFAGLVFDGGTAYAERRRMQNAAEAGALAGAYKLAYGGPSLRNQDVNAAINQYAINRNAQSRYGGQTADFQGYYIDANGNSTGASVKDNPGEGPINTAHGVMVIATTSFNTFFMNVIGMPVGTVSAQAKAIYGAPNNVGNLSPIMPKCLVPNPTSFADCGYKDDGTYYNLWDGGGPGNFGWANWSNTNDPKTDPICSGGGLGTPLLCENIRHPETMVYSHNCNPLPDSTPSLGDCVDGLTGVKNSSDIRDSLAGLIGPPPVPITVPIWGTSSGSGNNLQYNIISFATFVVTGYYLPQGGGGGAQYGNASLCFTGGIANGSGNCIVGYFTDYANVSGTGDLCISPCSGIDTGTRVVGLIGP